MFPCQRQCRRQENGKVGIPVSNHNPQLLFGLHPAQSQSTQRLPYSDPDRFQLLFTLTHSYNTDVKNLKISQLDESNFKQRKSAANLAFAQLFPAPVCPNTKLSGRNSWPKGPARTLSMVPATTSVGMKQDSNTKTSELIRALVAKNVCRLYSNETSIPTSDMCECSAESQCPMSAEMYLLTIS